MAIIEIPLGTEVIIDRKKYKVIENNISDCKKCAFAEYDCIATIACQSSERTDRTAVIFIEEE